MQFVKKTSENKSKQKDIYLILLPMILGICLCAVCLMGSTFAWFTVSQSTATQNIRAANYIVEVAVTDSNDNKVDAINESYTLSAGIYTVTLTAGGTASTGYCTISLNDEEYHTDYFPTQDDPDNKTISFTLTISEDTTMKIAPQWGSSSAEDGVKWKNRGTYPSSP